MYDPPQPHDLDLSYDPIEEVVGMAAASRMSPRHTGKGFGLGDLILQFNRLCYMDMAAQLPADQKEAADRIQDYLNEMLQYEPADHEPRTPPGSPRALGDTAAAADEKRRSRAVLAGEAKERLPAW